MEQKTKQSKIWILLGAAGLIAILLAVVLLTRSGQQKQEQTILLPEVRQTDTAPEPVGSDVTFTEVNAQNVRQIIESLRRPEYYHQVLTLSTEAAGKTCTADAELWRCGTLLRAEVTQNGTVQTLLTDGTTCYLWYDGDETAARIDSPSAAADELIGIPTYESILSLAPGQILEAGFVSLQEPQEQPCVFVDCEQDGRRQYYWIGLSSGLLFKHTALEHNQPVFSAQQTLLERLTEGDEIFSNRFLLPDGSAPFATTE